MAAWAPSWASPLLLERRNSGTRRAALAPQGAPPAPDPRLLEWIIPETCKSEERVCLAYSTTANTRRTYLAQAWREPRSFTARYGALLAGLSAQERRARLAKAAKAIAHPAVPEEERHHLYVNIHHGHWQGGNKCKGDQRYCAIGPSPSSVSSGSNNSAHRLCFSSRICVKVCRSYSSAEGVAEVIPEGETSELTSEGETLGGRTSPHLARSSILMLARSTILVPLASVSRR